MLVPILLIMVGFILLMGGAEYAVRGAAAIASRLHIPTLIIGLTIVALGTSIPEFVVSIKSALNGNAGISVGNVIGSNIVNVLLVLGASAMIYPISCDGKAFYRDFSFLFIVTLVFAFFVVNGKFINWNGSVLLGFLAVFLIYNFLGAQKDENPADDVPTQLADSRWWVILSVLAAGLTAIAYGAEFLMDGAVDVARIMGVPEEIIGVTVIAVGTSMPEMATSCVAAFRRQNGIALGNVIGSNIWNIVFVMGATSVITDVKVADQFILFDVWVMMFATFMLLPIMMFKNKISRFEGLLMFLCFIAYMYSQILISRGELVFM